MPVASRRGLDLLLIGVGHASVHLFRSIPTWIALGHNVTLLNDHPFLFYSGMLPEYLGGVYAKEDIRIDLQRLCRHTGARLFLGKAEEIDLASKTVFASGGRGLSCDLAVFDIGSVNPMFEAAAGVIPTKPLYHVQRLERALHDIPHGRLAIVGGGAAGVEIALNVSARHPTLRIVLIEASPRLVPEFAGRAGRIASELLSVRQVEVRLQSPVRSSTGCGVRLESGEEVGADVVLWATGTMGQAIFRRAGLPCDERDFLRVDESLRCPAAPWIFAAGDCAVVRGREDLRRVGVHAVKQGPLLTENVDRALRGSDALRRFRPYPVAPLILSTGTDAGLLVAGPVVLLNRPVLRLKHWLDRRWAGKFNRDVKGMSVGELILGPR